MASSEHFSLHWDNFHKNMCTGMTTLLEHEDLVDVTLAVEGQFLKAHKMVLSVCSPYFKELFKVNPCKHPIVFMKDVSFIAMSDLLQFMYNGEVHVSQENLPSFLKTAEALQITGLTGDSNVVGTSEKKKTENTEFENEYEAVQESNTNLLKMEPDDPEFDPLEDAGNELEFYDQKEDFAEDHSIIEEEDEESKPGTSSDISVTPSSISGLISSTELQALETETSTISEKDKVVKLSPFDLLPQRSRVMYEGTYNNYHKWRTFKKFKNTSEETILIYFQNQFSNQKSSSLWSKYSMLRSTILIKEGVDIKKFRSLIHYLRSAAKGYKPKKSLSFSRNLLDDFLSKADNKEHLLNKVVLIFGVVGACRCQELVTLLTTNVEDSETHILVKVQDEHSKNERSFVILPGTLHVNLLGLVRKYMALRPKNTHHKRFFVNYVREKCTTQPVGRHKIGAVPSVIAGHLGLENYTSYTGHCFRSTSALFLK